MPFEHLVAINLTPSWGLLRTPNHQHRFFRAMNDRIGHTAKHPSTDTVSAMGAKGGYAVGRLDRKIGDLFCSQSLQNLVGYLL